jgi:hypothetical protein
MMGFVDSADRRKLWNSMESKHHGAGKPSMTAIYRLPYSL